MTDKNEATSVGVGAGLGAFGGAMAAGMLNKPKPVSAGGTPTDISGIISLMEQMNAEIQNLNSNLTGGDTQILVQGYPKNCNNLEICRVDIGALVTAYRFPNIEIPDGYTALFKAWPTNLGIIYFGRSVPDVRNVVQVAPMLPNDIFTLNITNADMIYVSGTAVGDSISMIVEVMH